MEMPDSRYLAKSTDSGTSILIAYILILTKMQKKENVHKEFLLTLKFISSYI